MFGPLGFPELLFILVLALLIFGPRKLPEVGRTLGKGLAEFRKASNELKRTINVEMLQEELRESDPRKALRDLDPRRRPEVKRGAAATKAVDEAAPATAEPATAEPATAEHGKTAPATAADLAQPAASPRPVAVAEAVPRSTSGDDAEPEAAVP